MLDDIKKTLWAAADKLRANMDAAEYKHLVLGLIFLKYISDTFAARRAELTRRFTDEADDYFLHECDDEMLADELEDRDYYKEVNVFWVPEAARWEQLRAAAKQTDIGKRIDEALTVIEGEPQAQGHPRQALRPRPAARRQARRAGGSRLHHRLWRRPRRRPRRAGPGVRILPRPVRQRRGQEGRPVLHPASIVKTLVAVLAPHHGKVYDPAAAPAACSCSPKSSSRPTAASWATCPSTGRNPTPPPGAWRR
jgi:type I restriction enzyme M protein